MLYALGRRIRVSRSAAELEEIEGKSTGCCRRSGKRPPARRNPEVVALNVAAHRLENLIHDRRIALAASEPDHPAAPA